MKQAQTNGNAAAEPTRLRHFSFDMPVESKPLDTGRAEEARGGIRSHDMTLRRPASTDRNPIVDPERDPETIETRTKIRGRCGHTHGHFVHGRGSVAAGPWKGQL